MSLSTVANAGETPLDLARQKRDREAVSFLETWAARNRVDEDEEVRVRVRIRVRVREVGGKKRRR